MVGDFYVREPAARREGKVVGCSTKVDLLAWNIAGNDIGTVIEYARKIVPDVGALAFVETWLEQEWKWPHGNKMICFQELATRSHAKGRASGGLMVLVAKTLQPKLMERSRYYIKIKVIINSVKTVWVITYLPPQGISKAILDEFEKSITDTKDLPVIIMGDLNARIGEFKNIPNSLLNNIGLPLFGERRSKDKIVNQRGKWLVNIMEKLHLTPLNGMSRSDPEGEWTFIAAQGQSIPDLTLFSVLNPPAISNFAIGNVIVSDHFPQIISLGEEILRIEGPPSLRLSKECTELEQKKALTEMNTLVEVKESGFLNESNLQAQLMRILKNCRLVYTTKNAGGRTKLPQWWDAEMREATKKLDETLMEHRRLNLVETQRTYTELRKKWKLLKKEKRRKYDQAILDRLTKTTNSGFFWKLLKSLEKKHTNPGDAVKKEDWVKFYSGLFERKITPEEEWRGGGVFEPLLEGKFTKPELDLVLQKLKNKTAPGPDLIPAFLLKNTGDTWRITLLGLLNKIFTTQTIPSGWAQTRITPIYKDGPPEVPGNYRPISVINQVTKILTALMANRLQTWAEVNQLLQEEQNAFRATRSTVEHIFVLKSI